MKKFLSIVLCLSLLSSLLALTASAGGTNPFADVKEKDYFYDPVLWAVENGITTGTSATTFSPDKACTRAQVVTFLWRAAGSPQPSETANPFKDVAPKAYYYNAVLWAVENAITTGASATTFAPESPCTRAQVVTFLWRAAGKPAPEKDNNPFKDVSKGGYYYDAVLWAVEEGITTGTSATTFDPEKTCSRGQIVTFIYRYMTSDEPLTILFQPVDYYMASSQEDAEFSVQIKGGSAPYTYQWYASYDDEEKAAPTVTATSTINVFTANFSDYDFEAYRSIGVYCEITDSKGNTVQSDMAIVHPYSHKALTITSHPGSYYMASSQEDAEFTIQITGGVAPYSYEWIVLYDNEVKNPPVVESVETSNTFTWNFSDYDFEAYRDIGVVCIVTDSRGTTVESDMAEIFQHVPFKLYHYSEDYQMTSSQEDAEFVVEVIGGAPPYKYQWYVCYDTTEVLSYEGSSFETASTFTHTFTDYDFDEYREIGVFCVITDRNGAELTTGMIEVLPKG